MNPQVRIELQRATVRTRRCMGISVIAHLLLFSALTLVRAVTPDDGGVTEITWIDPSELVTELPPAEPEPAPVEPTRAPPVKPEPKPLKFQRQEEVADLAPNPQDVQAAQAKLSERLSSLQKASSTSLPSLAAPKTTTTPRRPKLAAAPTKSTRTAPSDLKRTEGSAPSVPTTLKRSRPNVQKAALDTALPEIDRGPKNKVPTSNIKRSLAGADMTGPVADRKIVSYDKPHYPDWAKREGVEGSVMIYFVVRPDGSVGENVMVQKTSGFADFDDNAVQAILLWRFQPLAAGTSGDQWGTIEFHYRLGDAN
jgi:protein TonB